MQLQTVSGGSYLRAAGNPGSLLLHPKIHFLFFFLQSDALCHLEKTIWSHRNENHYEI